MPIDEYRAVDVFVSDRNQIARTHGSVSKQIANDSGVNGFEYMYTKNLFTQHAALFWFCLAFAKFPLRQHNTHDSEEVPSSR